jgi:hypothetical protein
MRQMIHAFPRIGLFWDWRSGLKLQSHPLIPFMYRDYPGLSKCSTSCDVIPGRYAAGLSYCKLKYKTQNTGCLKKCIHTLIDQKNMLHNSEEQCSLWHVPNRWCYCVIKWSRVVRQLLPMRQCWEHVWGAKMVKWTRNWATNMTNNFGNS